MFDIPMSASALHRFAEEHYKPVQYAALLLGGRPWLRRVQRLLDHLQLSPKLSNHMRREAVALYDLLALEHVHDLHRPEAAYFAALDPADPHVEEICLLTECLWDALDETAVQPNAVVVGVGRGRFDV